MAAKWSPARGGLRSEAFPSSQECCPEGPGAVKGAPLLGAAKRTLDGEDRSEMIAEEGKAGERSAKGGPPFWYPRPPPLTFSRRGEIRRPPGYTGAIRNSRDSPMSGWPSPRSSGSACRGQVCSARRGTPSQLDSSQR